MVKIKIQYHNNLSKAQFMSLLKAIAGEIVNFHTVDNVLDNTIR